MRKILLLLLLFPILLFATSPFETPEPNSFDTSIYNTKETKETLQASNNSKIKCRYICDKKIYTQQKISDAVEFYKKTRNYTLSSD